MSDSGSDVDAEGSEDDEYAQIQNQSSALVKLNDPPTDSSSTSSGASRKRKTSIDEEEFMRTNPELYGLRRSVSGFARHGFRFTS
jgi:chromodomain-helicase-DNA-binding protein 1